MMMESNNTSNDVSLVYTDMSKLIRLKEKELQEVLLLSILQPIQQLSILLSILILLLLLLLLLLGS